MNSTKYYWALGVNFSYCIEYGTEEEIEVNQQGSAESFTTITAAKRQACAWIANDRAHLESERFNIMQTKVKDLKGKK